MLEKKMSELIELQKKNETQLAKTDAQLAKTDAQLAKTDAQLSRTTEILSNIGINLGKVTEEYFYDTLKEKMSLGEIKFDAISFNLQHKYKNKQDEFNIVMYNGKALAIIEIKHKVHPSDLEKLSSKKVESFRELFPQYKHHKIYLGIGGFSIPESIVKEALKKGIAVLKQKGEVTLIRDEKLKAY